MLGKAARGRLWLFLLLLIALPAIAVLIWRKELATWALTRALEDQQVSVASIEIAELGWTFSSLKRFSATAPGVSLKLDSADLGYSLAGLMAGELPDVSLSGLELELDPASPWLQARLAEQSSAGPNTKSEVLPPVPDITVEESELRLVTPLGLLEVGVEGSLWRDPTAAMIASVSLVARADQGESRGILGVTVTPDRSLLADLVVEEGSLDVGDLKVRGLSGSLSVTFDGQSEILERLHSDFSAADISGSVAPEIQLAPVTLAFESSLDGRDVTFSAELAGAGNLDRDLRATLSGRFAQVKEASRLSLTSRVETAASVPYLTGVPLPLPQTGRVTAMATARLALPSFAELLATTPPADLEEIVSLLRGLDAGYSFEAEALSHPEYLKGFSAEAAGRISLDQNSFAVTQETPVSLRYESLSAQFLNRFPLNEDLRNWLETRLVAKLSSPEADAPLLWAAREQAAKGPYRLAANLELAGEALELSSALHGQVTPAHPSWSLEGPVELQIRAMPLRSLSGIAGRTDLDLSGRFASTTTVLSLEGDLKASARTLRKQDLRLSGVAADLPFRAEWSGQRLHVNMSAPGSLDVQTLSTSAARSVTPLALQILSSKIQIDVERGQVSPETVAELAPAKFLLGEAEDAVALETAEVKLAVSPLEADRGKFDVQAETESVTLPDFQLRAADIRTRISADPASGVFSGRAESVTLEDFAEPRRFEEVFLSSSIKGDESGRIDFAGKGSSFQEAIAFTFEGTSDPGGKALVDVELPETDFAAKALNVKNLSWLSEAEVDQGTVTGGFRLEMSSEGPTGRADFKAVDLGGEVLGFPFSAFSMVAGLDELWPPRTSAPIRIDLASVNPGLPVSDLHIEAAFPDRVPFTLDLQDAALTLLGTQVSLQGGRLALLEGTAELPIRITGLDLAEILKQADLADVEVSGRLTGNLPIAFDDGAVTVRPSKLAATEPGVLRVRSEEMSSLLTGYGDEVNSMLRALEDFHYEDLSLTLEKTAEDDLTLLLSILGRNPAVLEGQPFRINLNLESNIGQILDTLGEGLELSKDLLSGRYSLQ